MPHQCTTCDRTFPDGSKAMLGGCPDCGGNKFQFLPRSRLEEADGVDGAVSANADAASPSTDARTAGDRAPTDRAADDILEAPVDPLSTAEPPARTDGPEDAAQATARRDLVSPDELPSVDDRTAILQHIARDARPADATEVNSPEARQAERERPDLETLRKELNDQFESIKIVAPGEYELNLMELYDREEYIIALEEDGRYVIDVPTGVGGGSNG